MELGILGLTTVITFIFLFRKFSVALLMGLIYDPKFTVVLSIFTLLLAVLLNALVFWALQAWFL